MPKKPKANPTLTRQRNAARKALGLGEHEKAITNYTRALAHKGLSPENLIELREGRSSAYKATGDHKAMAADLEILVNLQKEQQSILLASFDHSQAELEILTSIAAALVDQEDLYTIGQIVGQHVQSFFNAEIAAIGLYDEKSGIITVPYYFERGVLKEVPAFKYGQGVTSHVLKTRKPIFLANAKESKEFGAIYDDELPSETSLYAPILAGKKAIGVISIQHSKPNAYTHHELELLSSIASSMAVALENARLFDEIQQSNRDITAALEQQSATGEVLNALANSPTDIQPVLDSVAKNAAKICEADDVQIYRVAGDRLPEVAHFGPLPALQVGESLPLVKGLITGRAVLEKKPIHIEDLLALSEKEYPESAKLQKRLKHRTGLAMPLIKEGIAIGAIVARRNKAQPFTDKQIAVLRSFADQAAIAIENVRLFDETTQRNAELAVINSVQEALANELDIQSIYDIVGEKLREIFAVGAISIIVYDLKAKTNSYVYGFEEGQRTPNIIVPTNKWHQQGLDHGKSNLVNEGIAALAKKYKAKAPQGKLPKSSIWVPLPKPGNHLTAIMLMDMDHENAFKDSDMQLLETIASSMSVALDNARLFAETAQRNAELAVINSVQAALADELDIQAIYNIVGDKLREVFKIDAVAIMSSDLKTGTTTAVYDYEDGKYLPQITFESGKWRSDVIKAGKRAMVNERIAAIMKAEGREAPQGRLPKSLITVPLPKRGNIAISVDLMDMDNEHAFSESDAQLLETIASSMSVALDSARLFDETTQRNAELAVITSVQESLAQELDIRGIYEAVGEKIKDIFDAQAVVFGYYDHSTSLVHPYYFFEKGERLYPDPFPFTGMTKYQIAHGETVVINENLNEEGKKYGLVVPAGEMSKSGVWAILNSGEKVIGGISIQNIDHENAFSESDVRLLETLAASMSVALENARLFDESNRLLAESRKKQDELSTINTVGQALASELELEALIELIGNQVSKIFKADIAYLALHDRSTGMINFPFIYGEDLEPINFGEGIVSQIIQSAEPVLINRDEGWKKTEADVDRVGVKAKSYLGVPIMAGKLAIGAISVQSTKKQGRFSEADMNLLSTIASNVGVAMRNVQLFQESEKRAEEMETLAQLGVEISQELDLEALLKSIAISAQKSLKGQDVIIRSVEEDGSMPVIVAIGDQAEIISKHVGHLNQKSITGSVVKSGLAEIVNRPMEDQRYDKIPDLEAEELGPSIFVPLLSNSGPIGVLVIFRASAADKPFTQPDLNFAIGLGRQATSAIENARLFAEMERQKEYFETFFEYSPAAVVVVDFDGIVISWNPSAEKLFGYSEDEAVGRNKDDLVANNPLIKEEAEAFTQKFTERRAENIEFIGKRTRKDGSLVDVEVKGLPISVGGEKNRYLVIYHDISEIETARRAAEEANQAKSAFLANMSHELRTPLNAIIGFTRIVKRKGEPSLPEKQIDNLEKVLVSAEHLLGLINTILDIAKIEAGRMELQLSDFDLSTLIDGCLTTTQPLVRANVVKLSKSGPVELPLMHSDQEKIRRILINLLSNAAKFTHEGSIKVQIKLKGDNVTVSVKDSGIGIAEDNLRKIFEEFKQADNTTTREFGGTGLGLSISRSLAQLLGGDLQVSSIEGQGSIFSFTIPLRLGKIEAPLQDRPSQISSPAASEDSSKPLVLVIDDQPDVFHILQQNLEEAGYRVVGALSGEEGIEKARSLQPFAITLDIMMPKKDGWQVLYELKNDPDTKDIPVIILTIVDNKTMGLRLGASDYLVKPLDEKAVLEALERVTRSNGGSRPRKLLVVDDDPKVIDLVRQMFEGQEMLIETASNGSLALDRLEKSIPDVILLDLIMPKLNGFQFIEEIQKRAKLRDVPIIVLTAKSLSNKELSQLQNSVTKIVKKQGLASESLIKEIQKIVA